jgi:hypothetical protein
MDLMKAILNEHSKNQCLAIVNFIGGKPDRFSELVEVFLTGPYRVTQRAAWPLSVCCEKEPQLIIPHRKKILKQMDQPHIHDAVKRNVVRLLQFIEIPKQHYGKVAEVCFRLFLDTSEPIAIRVFAMTVLANLATKLPDLKNELIPVIEEQLPYGSAAFASRGRKVLKKLKA